MTLDGATLGVIFQGLAALAIALGLGSASRARRAAVDRGEFRSLQRENGEWARHGWALERRLFGAGLPVPPRPPLLEERYGPAFGGGGDDGGSADPGATTPASA